MTRIPSGQHEQLCSHSNELQLLGGGGARAFEPWSVGGDEGIPQPRSSSSAISLHAHTPHTRRGESRYLPPKLCSGRDGRCSPPDITSPSDDNVKYAALPFDSFTRVASGACAYTQTVCGRRRGNPRPPARSFSPNRYHTPWRAIA